MQLILRVISPWLWCVIGLFVTLYNDMKIGLFLLTCFSLLFQAANAAESATAEHMKVRLLVPQFFSSQEETLIGIHFKPDEHWHVYWKNPGDSGAAPKFNINTETADLGPIQWPYPQRLPVEHLTNFGYEGDVVYLVSVKPKAGNKDVTVKMKLEWLVCQIECLPGFADLDFKRTVKDKPVVWKDADKEFVQKFAQRIPAPSEQGPVHIKSMMFSQNMLSVKISAPDFTKVDLFPLDDFVNPQAPQKNAEKNEFIFKTNAAAKLPKNLSFVATYAGEAWQIDNTRVRMYDTSSDESIWSLLFFAVLGGFILNLMPCVFPVISIKAFSLLKTDGRERAKDCVQYALGVMTTFLILGGVFLLLRSLGTAVGWGFQLQSPVVILFLVLLFWLMALNFLGAFEIGESTQNFAGKFLKKSSSFGTGVLSVFVAAPCTGPFMGAALGAAVTLPPASALLIFLGLGFGLALPFLLFAVFPVILTWLPKPGAWMERLKEFFAFPLFATVIWLLWVLGQQTQTQGWFLASIVLLVVSLTVWLSKHIGKVFKFVLWLLTLTLISYMAMRLKAIDPAAVEAKVTGQWTPYDESKLTEARTQKRAVFVDFTAAWCITCQVNKQTVLDTAQAQELFKKADILLMRADWTRYDPIITQALSKLGRSSVPVYAFYPSDGSAPVLLPQLLTMSMIEELKEKK